MASKTGGPRGRQADKPSEIPKRGWKEIGLRVKDEIAGDHMPLLAAGVAFYAMLALFPALIAAVTAYGLVADPAQLQSQIQSLAGVLPPSAQDLLREQLEGIVAGSTGGLTLGVIGGLLGALWSASAGMQGLVKAVNVAYDEPETRPGWKVRLLSLGMTLAAIVGVSVAFGLVAVLPAVLGTVGLSQAGRTAAELLRWPLLLVLVLAALAAIYRYAPDRDDPKWRWVSWGSVVAALLWLGGSWLFSFYVSSFGSYNETYGSLGAVIVLLLWLFLTAFVVLLGAEINAEMEHQTARDTTRGKSEPRGRRGAFVADTLPGAEKPEKTG